MRFPLHALSALLLLIGALATWPVLAQAPSPQPPPPQPQQAAPAPAKPYKPVAVALPRPMNEPGFDAFRKQLLETVQKKDHAGLAKLVVTQGFFWEAEDGDKADKKKTGGDNLASALGLGGQEGWDLLMSYASDPTAAPIPDRQGIVCAPADPAFDDKELEELAKATETDPGEWGYPVAAGIDVRAGAQPNAPVTEKLGMHFVRVMPDTAPGAPDTQNQMPMLRIVLPSGKIGYVAGNAISPLGNDQLCYVKEADGWKIAGFIGPGAQ
jgi:hypothetical protein